MRKKMLIEHLAGPEEPTFHKKRNIFFSFFSQHIAIYCIITCYECIHTAYTVTVRPTLFVFQILSLLGVSREWGRGLPLPWVYGESQRSSMFTNSKFLVKDFAGLLQEIRKKL